MESSQRVPKKSLLKVQRALNKRNLRLKQARQFLLDQLHRLQMEEAVFLKLRGK